MINLLFQPKIVQFVYGVVVYEQWHVPLIVLYRIADPNDLIFFFNYRILPTELLDNLQITEH